MTQRCNQKRAVQIMRTAQKYRRQIWSGGEEEVSQQRLVAVQVLHARVRVIEVNGIETFGEGRGRLLRVRHRRRRSCREDGGDSGGSRRRRRKGDGRLDVTCVNVVQHLHTVTKRLQLLQDLAALAVFLDLIDNRKKNRSTDEFNFVSEKVRSSNLEQFLP
jgi:hypothetical protein